MSARSETATSRNVAGSRWAVWAGVFFSFTLFSAIRAPVPGVNEPHYLCKAKHYWNPGWCADDFFLNSANAHLVFYQTVGLLTRPFSLEQTAWIGRVLALGLLAAGWVKLTSRLGAGGWASLWAAWAFLGMAAVGNFSGEWMVGGVESKVFAYGFLFLALACWLDRRVKAAALWGGLAVSFHPLVGGWGVLCAGLATLGTLCFRARGDHQNAGTVVGLSLPQLSLGLIIFLAASLPGIWPAWGLLDEGSSKESLSATYVQVFYRLQHHLDPTTFSQSQYAGYGLMIVVWSTLRYRGGWVAGEGWWSWFVGASIVMALAGVVLGWGERPVAKLSEVTWRYQFLKFYPFRLADVMLPLALSVTTAGLMARGLTTGTAATLWKPPALANRRCWALFGSLLVFALVAPAVDRNPSRMKAAELSDWQDVCRWIREHTPPDAMVMTPPNSWAFKWSAQRAEYVSRKDCPQDTAGILEWNNRMRHAPVAALTHEPSLDYLITRKINELPLEPVYRNATFQVFDLED